MADGPRSRMLLNLRGERVYIGGAASLSFLQLVRGIVAEQIGPSQFSHSAQRDTMLEKESPSCCSNPSLSGVAELDAAAKLAFSRSYRAVTEGFIDVFAPSEMEDGLIGAGETGALPAGPRRRAAFELVMAIGAKVESGEAARDVGQQYFRQAQCDAFDGMLEDPDLDVVRSFLFMAFYLLGHYSRNAAFMYLGIATRAAVTLGLHSRESYADVTEPKDNLRLRVWLSLRIVDMLANSILGRSAATAGLHSDTKSIVDGLSGATQDDEMKRLVASHQIVSIINGIVDTLYERKELSTPVVEQLLGDIEAWAKELPVCLRTAPTSGEAADSRAQKGVIGSIRVVPVLLSGPDVRRRAQGQLSVREHVHHEVRRCLPTARYHADDARGPWSLRQGSSWTLRYSPSGPSTTTSRRRLAAPGTCSAFSRRRAPRRRTTTTY